MPSTVDFFKELPQFVVKAGSILSNIYGVDWENKLEVLGLQVIYFATLTARVDSIKVKLIEKLEQPVAGFRVARFLRLHTKYTS
ncbi:retinoblastoma-related protein 1-like isoform X2 [Pyrus communis]|uniref:retinoblastoma-related protein 1-like isoform X2 n=1 Tax=Pyrus communis TaxID=23211 RepID=UPI0035C206D7